MSAKLGKVISASPAQWTAAFGDAGYQWDYVFDWTILKYQQLQQNARPSDAGAGGARPRDESAGATFARATAGDTSRRR